MRTLPPEPSPGDKVSASLIRDIIRALRERTIIQGHGVKASFGPNGTVISANTAKSSKSTDIIDNGCFKIISSPEEEEEEGSEGEEEEEEAETLTFGNPYYSIGGKTYVLTANGGEENPSIEVTYPCIVYLKICANEEQGATLEYDSSIESMQSEQEDTDYYCIPLYSFDEDGALTCDFRNMPTAAMGEF